jgi:hypothetical protein
MGNLNRRSNKKAVLAKIANTARLYFDYRQHCQSSKTDTKTLQWRAMN